MSGGGMEQGRFKKTRPARIPEAPAIAPVADSPSTEKQDNSSPFGDLKRWVSGDDVYVPEVTVQMAAAIKAKELDLVRAALEHLRTMEGDRSAPNWYEQDKFHSTWFTYTMSLVRVIRNKCEDDDILLLADELRHIRDAVEEYKSHTSFNPLQYRLTTNPLVDIVDCINERIPDGK